MTLYKATVLVYNILRRHNAIQPAQTLFQMIFSEQQGRKNEEL